MRKCGDEKDHIWIAASAVETGSVIITYDKHFLNITQARVWDELQNGK